MTDEQIDAMEVKFNCEYEVARKIRQILDAAAEKYGVDRGETDSIETEILDLVTGDP